MKRDMEKVRELLLRIEALSHDEDLQVVHNDCRPETAVDIFHLQLIQEAGLAVVNILESGSSNFPVAANAYRLTNAGCEFLDKVRGESVWTQTKNFISSKGLDLSIEVVKAAAGKVVEGMLS